MNERMIVQLERDKDKLLDQVTDLAKQLAEAESVNKILDKAHADSHAREYDLINKLAQVEKYLHWWKITHPNDLAEKLAKSEKELARVNVELGFEIEDKEELAEKLAKAEAENARLKELERENEELKAALEEKK